MNHILSITHKIIKSLKNVYHYGATSNTVFMKNSWAFRNFKY